MTLPTALRSPARPATWTTSTTAAKIGKVSKKFVCARWSRPATAFGSSSSSRAPTLYLLPTCALNMKDAAEMCTSPQTHAPTSIQRSRVMAAPYSAASSRSSGQAGRRIWKRSVVTA